jgi:hypothetical protein
MARNYEQEKEWAKEKYLRFDVKLDREVFGETIASIKEELGTATFLKKALELYKTNPELFK